MPSADYHKGFLAGLDKAISTTRRFAEEEHSRADELHSRQLYMEEQEHRERESTLRSLIIELTQERAVRERIT